MKKISILLSLPVMICLFSSCLTDSDGREAGQFMPMAPGNRWVYKSGNPNDKNMPNEIWTVKGLHIKNLQHFYEIEKVYTYSDNTNKDYYRTEGDCLYILNNDGSRRLLADFSKQEGETFKSPMDEFTYTVTVTGYTETTRTFVYDAPRVVDEEHEITFTRNIGITDRRSLAWGVEKHLVEYSLK